MSVKSVPAQIVDAIKEEDVKAILSLFKAKPEQIEVFTPFGGQTWLGYASQLGKLQSVRTLIDIGFDVNNGDKRDNILPICSAAANGHLAVVRFLLANNSYLDVSSSVNNALFAAVVGRSLNIVKLLLESGIDSKTSYNSDSMKNMDAIAFALMRGEEQCAQAVALWNADGNDDLASKLLNRASEIADENAYKE
ncbi:ankyrin repeat domain-containing protein [Agaribacter flavus]|uniref:Ankyrin repeat domain-containing protein n=1 Tax=Agaribacter flavus TaxID=1902781 RepID=A0ABV7FQU5_9ALTE